MLDLRRKRVLAIGAGVTGRAVARALKGRVAELRVADDRPPADIEDAVRELGELGAGFESCSGAADEISRFDLVIPSPGVPPTHDVIVAAQSFGVPILSEIEIAYHMCSAPILAVTGTNGKSTVVALAAEMIKAAGREVTLAGNIRAEGLGVPLITAAAGAARDSIVVAEISSFQLEWVEGFRPKVGVLTNLGVDHLDRHRTREQYWAAKAKLFRRQTTDDFAVLPLDDPIAARQVSTDAETAWFSLDSRPESGAWLEGTKLHLSGDSGAEQVTDIDSIRLPGRHNVANVLAAAAAVRCFGVGAAAVARAARAFEGLPHRMERVATLGGVAYINNSMCTNVDAAVASIAALSQPLVVIAGGRDKGFDFEPFGRALAAKARHVALIGESARKLARVLSSAGFGGYSLHATMADAVQRAAMEARRGDTVILAPACASHDMFSDFEERGRAFAASVRALADGPVQVV